MPLFLPSQPRCSACSNPGGIVIREPVCSFSDRSTWTDTSSPISSSSSNGPIGMPQSFIASSIAGMDVPSPASASASARYGIRTRFTKKPGASPTRTGVFPIRPASAPAVARASASLSAVLTTSTSGIFGTGLKKCSPTTRPGRDVDRAISVMLSEFVLLARTASGRVRRSSFENTSRFRSIFSITASTMKSARPRPVHSVVGRDAVQCVAGVEQRHAAGGDVVVQHVPDTPSPAAAAALASTSTRRTWMPALTMPWTIPAPMVPPPITAA